MDDMDGYSMLFPPTVSNIVTIGFDPSPSKTRYLDGEKSLRISQPKYANIWCVATCFDMEFSDIIGIEGDEWRLHGGFSEMPGIE